MAVRRALLALIACLPTTGLAHGPVFEIQAPKWRQRPFQPVYRSVLGPTLALENYTLPGGEGAALIGVNWIQSWSSTAFLADLLVPRLSLGLEGGGQIDSWQPLVRAHAALGLGDGDLRGEALAIEGSVITEDLGDFGYGGALSFTFASLGEQGPLQDHLALRFGRERRAFGGKVHTVWIIGLRCTFGRTHKWVGQDLSDPDTAGVGGD